MRAGTGPVNSSVEFAHRGAARHESARLGPATRGWRCTSNVESEVHDIALLDDVLLAFETQFACIPRT